MESLKVISFLCSASLVQNFISYMLGLPYGRSRSFHQHLPTIFCFDRYQRSRSIHWHYARNFWWNEAAERNSQKRLWSTAILQAKKKQTSSYRFFVHLLRGVSHSMTVERCVTTYILFHAKHRQSASEDTLIDWLLIYWNGVATAEYDPRPVVMQFLLKERRKKFHTSKLTASDSLSKGFLNKSWKWTTQKAKKWICCFYNEIVSIFPYFVVSSTFVCL